MKKILNILICTLLCLVSVSSISAEEPVEELNTKAEDYPMACEAFEVSYINDSGTFDKVACFDDFDSANNKMKELGGDHVVRYAKSYSPTKIVSMVSGRAYSYPARSGKVTMNIYSAYPEGRKYKTAYITNHYEMMYHHTALLITKSGYEGIGMIRVEHNGMDGYTDLEYTDLVPSKFFDKGLPIILGGKDKTSENEQPFKVIPRYNYYSVEQNGNYTDLVFHAFRAYPQSSQTLEPIAYTYHVDKAPKSLTKGAKYYSSNGYEFYNDVHLQNLVLEYYPYYQFLPLRSESSLSGDKLNKAFIDIKGNIKSKIKDQGNLFVNAQSNYGVNSLLLYSMGAHESAWGTSHYALDRNNLFGWDAVDSNPDNASKFASVEACVNQMAGLNLRGYLDVDDFRFFGLHLGNKGSGFNVKYASDPYWGASIASVAYNIDKASNNYDGSLTDHNKEKLVKVTTYDAKAYKKADANAGAHYTTSYWDDYQENYITSVIDVKNGFIKTQSANPISNGNVIHVNSTKGLVAYDRSQSIVYFKTSDVKGINGYNHNESPQQKPEQGSGKVQMTFNQFGFSEDKKDILIDGYVLKSLQNLSNASIITKEAIIYELSTGKEVKRQALETYQYNGLNFNDGYDYSYAGVKGKIDISGLAKGEYGLSIKVTNGEYNFESNLYSRNPAHYFNATEKNDLSYVLSTSNVYRNRFELKIEDKLFDYTKVKKPTYRDSVASFAKLKLEGSSLVFDGYAYMRNVNHAKDNKVDINLYLKKANQLIDLKANTLPSKVDYTSILKSKYDLSHISSEVNYDLSSIEKGTYDIVVEIVTNEYYDVINLTDIQYHDFDALKINDKTYDLVVNKDRAKVQLVVE